MKQKKITLQLSHGISPAVGLHTYYLELLRQLPPNVTVVGNREGKEYWKKDEAKKSSVSIVTKTLKAIADTVGMPNMWPVKSEADILYCCQHLPVGWKREWILDIDHPAALVRYSRRAQRKWLAQAIIRKKINEKNCKAIVFWSEAAKRAFLAMVPSLPKPTLRKMHVIYPSLQQSTVERNPHSAYNIFFVANLFGQKGGPDLVEAFVAFRKRHPEARLTIVASLDAQYKRKYAKRGITFKERMPHAQLLKEFQKADVFAYPTKMDIFGIVILEALSAGLLVITTDDFCTREVVKGGGIIIRRSVRDWFDKDGLLAMNCDYHSRDYQRLITTHDTVLQQSLIDALEELSDPERRKRYRQDMSRFSPEERQKKLALIFKNI